MQIAVIKKQPEAGEKWNKVGAVGGCRGMGSGITKRESEKRAILCGTTQQERAGGAGAGAAKGGEPAAQLLPPLSDKTTTALSLLCCIVDIVGFPQRCRQQAPLDGVGCASSSRVWGNCGKQATSSHTHTHTHTHSQREDSLSRDISTFDLVFATYLLYTHTYRERIRVCVCWMCNNNAFRHLRLFIFTPHWSTGGATCHLQVTRQVNFVFTSHSRSSFPLSSLPPLALCLSLSLQYLSISLCWHICFGSSWTFRSVDSCRSQLTV